MIRRKQPVPPPPGPPWRQRVQAARAIIRRHKTDAVAEARLDRVEAALAIADQDRAKLDAAVRQLDPARVSAELKAALRSGDTPERLVTTLRRRHEMVHSLSNRLEEMNQQIDLRPWPTSKPWPLASPTRRSPRPAATRHSTPSFDQLHLDVTALAAAHREIADL